MFPQSFFLGAQSLAGVLGSSVGRIVFDLGFMGMACGAISAHMVCCGFTVCEMFGLEYTPKRYRLFTLVPAIGVLGAVTVGTAGSIPLCVIGFAGMVITVPLAATQRTPMCRRSRGIG